MVDKVVYGFLSVILSLLPSFYLNLYILGLLGYSFDIPYSSYPLLVLPIAFHILLINIFILGLLGYSPYHGYFLLVVSISFFISLIIFSVLLYNLFIYLSRKVRR